MIHETKGNRSRKQVGAVRRGANRLWWGGWCVAVACFGPGCTLFPGTFPEPGDAGSDGGNTAAFTVSDRCEPTLSLSESSSRPREITFVGRTDTVRDLSNCAGPTGLMGPDMFVQFDTVAGDRWRVKAEPLDGADVIISLYPGCLTDSCDVFQDICGPGMREDFTFVSPTAGAWGLGIDAVSGSGRVELTLLKTECGNQQREIGEACDDGNLEDGDGYTRECFLERIDGNKEAEPNNGPTESNVLSLEGARTGTVTVEGDLGGACDQDFYAVTVRENQNVRVVMQNGAGSACGSGTPATELRMFNANLTLQGRGMTGLTGGTCPEIGTDAIDFNFAQGLEAGTYIFSLAAPRDVMGFPYTLRVDVTDGT